MTEQYRATSALRWLRRIGVAGREQVAMMGSQLLGQDPSLLDAEGEVTTDPAKVMAALIVAMGADAIRFDAETLAGLDREMEQGNG